MYGSEPQLLLVEKDLSYGNLLKGYFQALHFNVMLVLNSEDAFHAFASQHFDIGVIEVDLPDGNGLSLVARLRERNPSFPIIIVSDLTTQADVLKGLRSGADDYVRKPFDTEELTLRIYAKLRLAYPVHRFTNSPTTFAIGTFVFDVVHQTIQRPGEPEVRLTAKESELLRQLALHMNKVLPREYALKTVWEEFSSFNARSMDVYITKLRKILKHDPNVEILNVRGKGFKLVV
ncbi:MAG: response regulator transcription factor [Bacteroides sp.]